MGEDKNNQKNFLFDESVAANLRVNLKKSLSKFAANDARVSQFVDVIIDKYCEKERFYHNLSHIENLLTAAEKFNDKITDNESLRLAIWFHDVIYQPKKQNNESESAKLAAECLGELNFPRDVIEKIERVILATHKHDAAGLDFDGKLFLDLDLGILGAKPEIYHNYKQAIRREYSFVPWSLYRRSRAHILANFLGREFIYLTDKMRGRFEAAARANVANEIKELS